MLEMPRQHILDELYRSQLRPLCRFLRLKLPDPQEAEEVAHEAYMRLCRSDKRTRILSPRAFLYRVAVNLVTDKYRALKKRKAEVNVAELKEGEELIYEGASPEKHAAARQQLERLSDVIRNLPPRCREVFILHRFKQITHSEISHKLGISRQMVEKHIAKAVRRCREKIDYDQ